MRQLKDNLHNLRFEHADPTEGMTLTVRRSVGTRISLELGRKDEIRFPSYWTWNEAPQEDTEDEDIFKRLLSLYKAAIEDLEHALNQFRLQLGSVKVHAPNSHRQTHVEEILNNAIAGIRGDAVLCMSPSMQLALASMPSVTSVEVTVRPLRQNAAWIRR